MALLAAVPLLALDGCASNAPAPSRQMTRVDTIVKNSGGDWNKLTPADRDYMVNVVGKGSEMSAMMTFRAKAGALAPGAKVHH